MPAEIRDVGLNAVGVWAGIHAHFVYIGFLPPARTVDGPGNLVKAQDPGAKNTEGEHSRFGVNLLEILSLIHI